MTEERGYLNGKIESDVGWLKEAHEKTDAAILRLHGRVDTVEKELDTRLDKLERAQAVMAAKVGAFTGAIMTVVMLAAKAIIAKIAG